jgi:hypothetical protein
MPVRPLHENREISSLAASAVGKRSASGRRGVQADDARAGEVRPLHTSEETGEQPWPTGAESAEPREGAEGNTGQPRTRRTLSRVSVSPGLDRVREAERFAVKYPRWEPGAKCALPTYVVLGS